MIYSGRLLLDYQLIKEVIELSDGDNQNTFTFHLVCPQKPAISLTNDNGDKDTKTLSGSMNSNAIPTSTIPPNISLDPLTNTTNGTGISSPWNSPMSNLNNFQMDPDSMLVQQSYQTLLNQYYQYMIYNFLSAPPIDFVSYATLANAYVQSLNGAIPSQTFGNQQQTATGATTNINTENRANNNNNGNNGNNINPIINNNMRLIGENDDIFNRDWTDLIYSFSKAVVLLSIFYFYSSINRLVLFIFIFFAIYLYKNLLIHHLNPDRPNLENMGLLNNNNNGNQMRNIPNQEANVPNNPDNNNNNPNSNALAQDNSRYSGLRFVWVFITSLFTSLIPDPNPI